MNKSEKDLSLFPSQAQDTTQAISANTTNDDKDKDDNNDQEDYHTIIRVEDDGLSFNCEVCSQDDCHGECTRDRKSTK